MQFVIAHKTEILVFLLAASELLALNPKVKSNSIFQLISKAIMTAGKK